MAMSLGTNVVIVRRVHCIFNMCFQGCIEGEKLSEDVIRKEHESLDNCAKACLDEKTINCKYFKFVKDTGTCFLSAKDHPDFSNYDKIEGRCRILRHFVCNNA